LWATTCAARGRSGPAPPLLSTPFDGGASRQVDIGKRGFSVGDMFTVTGQPVSDEATGRRAGSLDAMETVVSGLHDGTVSMVATLRLADGTLHGGGVVRHTDEPVRLPVTGGTGAYAGASGQLTVTEDAARKRTIMRLELQ
jgi:Allene oxide cyclase barrel like domain